MNQTIVCPVCHRNAPYGGQGKCKACYQRWLAGAPARSGRQYKRITCQECGRENMIHIAHGLCGKCYWHMRHQKQQRTAQTRVEHGATFHLERQQWFAYGIVRPKRETDGHYRAHTLWPVGWCATESEAKVLAMEWYQNYTKNQAPQKDTRP